MATDIAPTTGVQATTTLRGMPSVICLQRPEGDSPRVSLQHGEQTLGYDIAIERADKIAAAAGNVWAYLAGLNGYHENMDHRLSGVVWLNQLLGSRLGTIYLAKLAQLLLPDLQSRVDRGPFAYVYRGDAVLVAPLTIVAFAVTLAQGDTR